MERRSFNIAEFRFVDKRMGLPEYDGQDAENDEDESDEDDRGLATGYASVYNSLSEDLGGFREIVAPSAFTRSLIAAKAGDANIYAYWAHDPSKPIGSTQSKTLDLNSDDKGLAFTLSSERLDNMQSLALRDGDMQMSFGFIVRADEWSPDYSLRTITDCDLLEISPVTTPAYSATSAGMRSADADISEALRSLEKAKAERGNAQELVADNKYNSQALEAERLNIRLRLLNKL